jgi:hypothetical protein
VTITYYEGCTPKRGGVNQDASFFLHRKTKHLVSAGAATPGGRFHELSVENANPPTVPTCNRKGEQNGTAN